MNKREQNSNSICVLAGDPSGDIAGFHFLQALNNKYPGLSVFGLGGAQMKSAGQEQFVDGAKLAALGFWEVARRFLFFRNLFNHTLEEIKRRRPRAVVMIDYPGFNLRLAERIKPLGIPIIYYVAPQVWAWGAKRIPLMREVIDRLLLILPFEVEFFAGHDIEAEYVGHYLLDDIPERLIGAEYDEDSPIVALLPGSRQQEIDRMLPTLLALARRLGVENWNFKIAGISRGVNYDKILRRYPEFRRKIVFDITRDLIAESRLVISSSGTATLETALIGRPLIALYKTGWITYQIAKRLVDMPNIALANIVAGKTVAAEFVQGEANPSAISAVANNLLGSLKDRRASLDEWGRVREIMGVNRQPGAAERVAQVVAEYL